MKKRIVIELGDDEVMEGLVKDIVSMVMFRIDSNAEFNIRQEFIADREAQDEIHFPEFMAKRNRKEKKVCF